MKHIFFYIALLSLGSHPLHAAARANPRAPLQTLHEGPEMSEDELFEQFGDVFNIGGSDQDDNTPPASPTAAAARAADAHEAKKTAAQRKREDDREKVLQKRKDALALKKRLSVTTTAGNTHSASAHFNPKDEMLHSWGFNPSQRKVILHHYKVIREFCPIDLTKEVAERILKAQ